MKPLNLDNRPCSPISSNCVVWQGPTLDCISLCTGDTISDVVAKLATELCTLLDQTNVANYDLSCLGITACGPKDFQALIQLLIEKICELSGLTTDTTRTEGACPDCVITVATCLRETDQGLPVTMQLIDYVQVLANKICTLIDQIGDLQTQVNNLDIRVTILEEALPPEFTIPSFTLTSCAVGALPIGSTQFINIILQEFINNVWCPFYAATGSTSELINAVDAICIEDSDLQLTTGTAFGLNPNWIQSASYNTVADAINNIWVALCDVYNAVADISLAVEDTNTIDLTLASGTLSANIVDTGWVDLLGFNWYTGNSKDVYQPQCRRIGNVVHFRGILMIPLSSGGALIDWNYGTGDTYSALTSVLPYTAGPGGVVVDTGGSITFNQGNSVIPNSVVSSTPTNFNFEKTIQSNYVVASRNVLLETGNTIILTTVVKIWITANKKLLIQFLRDNEFSASGQGGNIIGTSVLNTLVSRVNQNDRVPQFARVGSEIAGNTTAGQQPLTATYYPDPPLPAVAELYPFTCDAGNPAQTGGFGWLSLDGMMQYLEPCNLDVKAYGCK